VSGIDDEIGDPVFLQEDGTGPAGNPLQKTCHRRVVIP
jgi:hypothetical protein